MPCRGTLSLSIYISLSALLHPTRWTKPDLQAVGRIVFQLGVKVNVFKLYNRV
jgi:hypothetical protein